MHELRLICPEDRVETLSEALEALDALSVSTADADADSEAERALFGEPGMPPPAQAWERSELRALFPDERAAQEAAVLLAAQEFFEGCAVLAVAEVPDADWVRLTQSQFEPVSITEEFWVVPSWHEAPAAAKTVIRLDPGLAFGTGTHPTTLMCLRWLATNASSWPRMLDYGCGSGILAIGALLLGARTADAVDIDAAAIQSTQDNAAVNGVTVRAGDPAMASGGYPLVVANILAQPLKLLAPLLCGHVEAGGRLILAGILERQVDELRQAYAPWLALEVLDSLDGWVLMGGQRTLNDDR